MADAAEQQKRPLDTQRKFVLIRDRRKDGFVEFDFAIGEPEIFVEMILTQQAFDEFCQENQVQIITEADLGDIVTAEQAWRLSESSGHQFRH